MNIYIYFFSSGLIPDPFMRVKEDHRESETGALVRWRAQCGNMREHFIFKELKYMMFLQLKASKKMPKGKTGQVSRD